jgi:DNA-directed RNA polymerase subunit RPC12/RpoP
VPAYNCRECNASMDPTESVRCPSCNEKNPLNCSKCSAAINHHDIHEIAKLRVKKPLLCLNCGADNEVLKCGLCNIGLVRSQGETVSPLAGAKVYHKKCLVKRMEAVGVANKAAPISFAVAVVIGLIFMATGAKGWGSVSLLLGCTLFIVVKMIAKIIHPR